VSNDNLLAVKIGRMDMAPANKAVSFAERDQL
jgi:hypothetical protein